SQFHDEIFLENKKIKHNRNNAGGIEGGMSNGEEIVAQIFMKPIPTLMKPLHSVDLKTKQAFMAHKERSDVTAVPACSVVAEAVTAHIIADAFCEKFGNDTVIDMEIAYQNYLKRIQI
ncbi:MAG: chorismate synthase, partial [Caldisericaceae bacterium]|nr:chorismate synthase [Caldisericaceae bacterium]